MNYREDLRMGMRSVISRPAESLLLSLGVALAVGATAAGMALASQTGEQSRNLLSSPRYREIVVAAREEADEMDLPAQVQISAEVTSLTAADLEARSITQAIQYAYLANRTSFRFGESGFGRLGGNQNQDQGTQVQGQSGQGDLTPGRQFSNGRGGQFQQRPGGSQTQVDRTRQAQGGQQGQTQGQQTDSSTSASGGWASVSLPEGPQPQIEFVEGWEVTPEFFDAWDLVVSSGDVFQTSDLDRGEPLLVLGATLGSTLFEDGEAVGRQVLSRNQLYRIIGVLEPSGKEVDKLAFAPAIIAAEQFQGFRGRFQALSTNLRFMVEDPNQLEEARVQLANWFDSSHGVGAVAISVPRAEAESIADRNGRLATIILFLALSSLLIAAVNVTNIFFSRAVRKRRTVGILKALGASIYQVFTVFFLEALAIGAVGAGFGLGLSKLLSRLMEQAIGFGPLQIGLIIVGVIVSWGLVTVFNVVPASAAARVPAADAIRYE